jgi:hypothetical protein
MPKGIALWGKEEENVHDKGRQLMVPFPLRDKEFHKVKVVLRVKAPHKVKAIHKEEVRVLPKHLLRVVAYRGCLE